MLTSVPKAPVLSDNSSFALANNSASAAVAASSGGVPLAARATNLQDRSSVSPVEVAPLHSTKKPPAGPSRRTDSVQLKVEETESSDSTSMAFAIDSSVSFVYTQKKEKKYCVRTAAAALPPPPPKRSRSDPFLPASAPPSKRSRYVCRKLFPVDAPDRAPPKRSRSDPFLPTSAPPSKRSRYVYRKLCPVDAPDPAPKKARSVYYDFMPNPVYPPAPVQSAPKKARSVYYDFMPWNVFLIFVYVPIPFLPTLIAD